MFQIMTMSRFPTPIIMHIKETSSLCTITNHPRYVHHIMCSYYFTSSLLDRDSSIEIGHPVLHNSWKSICTPNSHSNVDGIKFLISTRAARNSRINFQFSPSILDRDVSIETFHPGLHGSRKYVFWKSFLFPLIKKLTSYISRPTRDWKFNYIAPSSSVL